MLIVLSLLLKVAGTRTMESESAYSSVTALCSLILAASATKWFATELRGTTPQCLPAQSCLCAGPLQRGVDKAVFLCHRQFIYIAGWGYERTCPLVQNYFQCR